MEDPPEDAYGRVTNPERFAPLIPAAEDLIVDLERRFIVTVSRGSAPPTKSQTVATLEQVKIVPAHADQATLALTLTSFPGLYLRAGAWTEVALPHCGCDACAETAEQLREELIECAEATAAGHLRERITGRFDPVFEHAWEGDGWGRSDKSWISASEAAQLRAQPVQPPVDGRWRPWSPRF